VVLLWRIVATGHVLRLVTLSFRLILL